MIKRTLRPFIGNEVDAVEGIEYGVWREGECIGVEYDLYGLLSHLVIPDYLPAHKRCDDLWQHTCFELFLREADEKKTNYYECNFSPAGNWNVYRFSSYRKGMMPANTVRDPILTIEKTKKIFSLRAEVDLTGLVPDSTLLEVGVSCIIENCDGKHGFWALSHPGEAPDFHDPQSFIIRLR